MRVLGFGLRASGVQRFEGLGYLGYFLHVQLFGQFRRRSDGIRELAPSAFNELSKKVCFWAVCLLKGLSEFI